MNLGTRPGVFGRVFTALVFLFLYLPIVLLIVFSFNAGSSGSVWQGFSLHWYQGITIRITLLLFHDYERQIYKIKKRKRCIGKKIL